MSSVACIYGPVKSPCPPETGQTQTATAIPQPPETVRWLPARTTFPDCFTDNHATHATTINKHVTLFCLPLSLNPSTHQEAR